MTTKYVKYRPKTLGDLTAKDLQTSGHVTIPAPVKGTRARLIYLAGLDCIHHGTDTTGNPFTYLSDAHDITVIAPSTSRWEVETP